MRRVPYWLCLLFVLACNGQIDGRSESPISTPEEPQTKPFGEVHFSTSRQIRRLSADQFAKSLLTATGQDWENFEKFAGAMGRPNLVSSLQEHRELSVTFEKLAEDAAFAACSASLSETPEILLANTSLSERDPERIYANIRRLYLRFLTQSLESKDDPRAEPWLELMLDESENISDDEMKERWIALCVGLATHPDFYVY